MIDLPKISDPQSPYLANMRALWRHTPSLAQQIDLVDELDHIDCVTTRSGELSCQLPGESGKPVYMHSRYDPVREASRWADGVEQQELHQSQPTANTEARNAPGSTKVEVRSASGSGDGRDVSGSTDGHDVSGIGASNEERVAMCYFVDGFGLGYHILALFTRLQGDAFIVVSEPNVALLRTALEHFDYSELFANDRLIVITRNDRDEIFRKLQGHIHSMMMGITFTRPLQNVNRSFHSATHTLLSEYVTYMRSNLATTITNSFMTCKNILHNLPTYVATPSIDILQSRFAGLPAVVVSAGPSLQAGLATLREIRPNVVVIAVQTTLKPLLAAGIVPDFVTSLDYHEVGRKFFEGIEDLNNIHLIAEPKAHFGVIDYYRDRGPLSLLGNEFARLVLGDDFEDTHANLPGGSTVAHLAFYLAQYLGADPIIFVGQDLGFTNNVYYSPGVAIHKVWRGELNRFCTIEMKEWERIVRNRNILRKVPGKDGGTIYSDEQMFTYLQQFEKDFAKSPARVIDATEGGSAKQFCHSMSLKDAAKEYCRVPIDRDKFDYRDRMSRFDSDRLAPALECVRQRISAVREFADIVKETIVLLEEMTELVDDQPAFNRRMVRVDELRMMVKQRTRTHQLLSHIGQAAEMFRYRRDRTIDVRGVEGKDRQRRQLRRDIAYVSELGKSCDRMITLLEECTDYFGRALVEID